MRESPNYGELLRLYRQEKNVKLKERYYALILMHEYKNCTKVAKIIEKSRVSV